MCFLNLKEYLTHLGLKKIHTYMCTKTNVLNICFSHFMFKSFEIYFSLLVWCVKIANCFSPEEQIVILTSFSQQAFIFPLIANSISIINYIYLYACVCFLVLYFVLLLFWLYCCFSRTSLITINISQRYCVFISRPP